MDRPALRCRVCGGPAFDCKCWQVYAYQAEADRCTAKLSGSLSKVERVIYSAQREAALRLRNLVAGTGATSGEHSTRTLEMF